MPFCIAGARLSPVQGNESCRNYSLQPLPDHASVFSNPFLLMLFGIGVPADNTLDLASDNRLFVGMGAKFIPCC